jgi:proteasome lid subunit RPN8/RPN11
MLCNSNSSRFRMKKTVWNELHSQLFQRGENKREAGAFFLGVRVGHCVNVTDLVYYDDLDPQSKQYCYIRVQGHAYGRLWSICRSKKLDVVADVHTHPGQAFQSQIDRANPMVDQAGHLALILPHYGQFPEHVSSIGLFEHLGSRRWKTLSDPRSPTLALEIY